MRRDDLVRIRHMLDAAQRAMMFVGGKARSDLDADPMLAFAIVRAIEIVGEAAARVSEETRARHPEIPWQDVVGMRNRLVHAYFDIDLDTVWRTTTEDLPALAIALAGIVAD